MDSDSSEEEVLVPSQKPGIRRKSRSLSVLTKRFISLLEEAEHGVLNLRHAFTVLAVKRIRRIYDITSVLEGIGLIVKISKCHVKWVGRPHDKRLLKLKSELKDLKRKEFILEQQRIAAEVNIRSQTEDWKNLTYVTHEDICNCFCGQILLTVQAPPGTQLDVPIPKAIPKCPAKYQIYLKSIQGPIDVALLNKRTVGSAPVVLPVPPPEEILQRAKSAMSVSKNKENNDGLCEASAFITKSTPYKWGAEHDGQPLQTPSIINANFTKTGQNISNELHSHIDSSKGLMNADHTAHFTPSEAFSPIMQLSTFLSKA